MADEWYRDTAWDEPARADFEARLARARPHNRQQYLYLKALSVRTGGDDTGARLLLERAADHPDGTPFLAAGAWEALADLHRAHDDRDTAGSLYRRVLTEQPSLSGTSGNVEISLAELLLDTGRAADRDEAVGLLQSWQDRASLRLPSDHFRWHLALIRAAQSLGDRDTVRRAAGTALRLASTDPQLSRHPGVGVVITDRATLRRLRRLAR